MNTLLEDTKPVGESRRKTAERQLNIRNILVPIDFSRGSETALSYAEPLARQFGAKITLLYAAQEQLCGTEFAWLPSDEEAVNWAANDQLKMIASRWLPPELIRQTVVRHGVAYEQIAEAAEELNIDLIIINTHGYSGLRHVLVGSTAERVIRHAPCPVLVVRQDGREAE